MKSRNIVILSDGTGNSAAKITKTNIWRIYEALDLEKSEDAKNTEQLVFYDDGVGTGGSQLMRAIGGAFGYGLARNVRQLYLELCRHYRANEKGGDDIYLLGFSRGAFTVRVLSGVIGLCGIINRDPEQNLTVPVWRWTRLSWEQIPVSTDEGLKAAVKIAYRCLRKEFKRAWITNRYRYFRDKIRKYDPVSAEKFRQEYAVSDNPKIKFMGVFDTVSAYGLPVDELTIAVDRLIVPLRFPDNVLADSVENASQALALDEARHTFHPVLWTEEDGEKKDREERSRYKRPKQVWFAGMHADVGGGYADDRLSFVPCLWMIEQATEAGLRFRPAAVADLQGRATKLGDMHDSRRGFAAFYRYKPRLLRKLGQEDLDGDGKFEVKIPRFKIHHTVFERIKDTGADYAPVGIPADYDVVLPPDNRSAKQKRLNLAPAAKAKIESDDERAIRASLQKNIDRTIVRRKIAYFATLIIALATLLAPFWWLPNPGAIREGWAATAAGLLTWPLALTSVPGTQRIELFWTQYPWVLFGLLAAFAASWLVSATLAASMQRQAQDAWGHLAKNPPKKPAALPERMEELRELGGRAHTKWTKKWLPRLLVAGVLPLIVLLVVWRWWMFKNYEFGSVCEARTEMPTEPFQPIIFDTKMTCFDTGIEMKEGRIYRITIRIEDDWKDNEFPADPTGIDWPRLSFGDKTKMAALSFTRRFWSEDWFAMMGSIGKAREFAFRIDATPLMKNPEEPVSEMEQAQTCKTNLSQPNTFCYRFQAWRSGTLYLFVNDAITPWGDYYGNNHGTAEITVKQVDEI